MPITASMLYNLVECPHRVTMDLFGDPAKRDEPNAFIELLWERGSLFEKEVISGLKTPYADLSGYAGAEKERLTTEVIARGENLIYGGRMAADDLVGEPDLLRRENGGYAAEDIKSGSGEEGPEESPGPKLRYAVQLALYTDILERKKLSAGRRGFIWDIHGREVLYDLAALRGKRNPRPLWQDYEECLAEARAIAARQAEMLPAYAGVCKNCHWYSECVGRVKELDDLTLIPELGRAKRDTMMDRVRTVTELARADPAAFMAGKKTVFLGIGPDSLLKFHERARLLTTAGAKPLLRAPVTFPDHDRELFFDIETDPLRGICYLHGFIERHKRDNASEKFISFFADEASPAAEKAAFAAAVAYWRARRPCAVYYYSKYERTYYRALQEKYPDVCSPEEIEELFNPAHTVDLYYDVVTKATEWPTSDHSIKTLAKYLGFTWRDTHPSGAASIEWFHRWIETRDPQIRQRILDYNEDDCRATRVLLDGIRGLT